jgi:hypothetical protein
VLRRACFAAAVAIAADADARRTLAGLGHLEAREPLGFLIAVVATLVAAAIVAVIVAARDDAPALPRATLHS